MGRVALPDKIFKNGYSGDVPVGGGKILRVNCRDLDLDIYDPLPLGGKNFSLRVAPSTAHFSASLGPYKGEHVIMFSIKSWDMRLPHPGPKAKYPGIEPGRLIGRALRYFEEGTLRGKRVRYLAGLWDRPKPEDPDMSTNWHQYWQAKKRLSASLSGAELIVQSAFSTWTGDQARKRGFVESDAVIGGHSQADGVHAYFKRP